MDLLLGFSLRRIIHQYSGDEGAQDLGAANIFTNISSNLHLAGVHALRTFAQNLQYWPNRGSRKVFNSKTMFNFTDVLTISLILFAVIDILGSIPVIIDLRNKLGHIHSERATIVSGGIMIVFLFIGQELLNLIGLDVSSFALAGAVVIFIIAMEMVLDRNFFRQNTDPGAGSVVPIAFPLIAGAGTLTTLMSLRANYADMDILLAIVINLVPVYLALKFSGRLAKFLGPGGLAILRRVFGIILLAMAIKLFQTNIA